MVDLNLKHENSERDGSRYATNFDHYMHSLCAEKFKTRLKHKNIMELGCYHGHMTNILALLGNHVFAVDSDPQCIVVSR